MDRIQTKYIIHAAMLILWLFACVGQPVVTIFEDGSPIVNNNLNEEEQKEQQGKKNNEEEKIISNSLTDFVFHYHLKKTLNVDIYSLSFSHCIRQIDLPPPERTV